MEQKFETNRSPSMALSSVGFYLLELFCVVGKNSLSGVYKPGILYNPIHSVPSRFHLKYTEINKNFRFPRVVFLSVELGRADPLGQLWCTSSGLGCFRE